MISVVIPLYNKEAIIRKSLESVLTQDYDDFEVVVVNDGSTDRSAEIVKSIHDPRITLIEQKNGGPSKARNTGVKHAKGEWILFLDADDELLPGALTILENLAEEYKNADIIDCGLINLNGQIVKEIRPHSGWSRNNLKNWYFNRIGPGSDHSIFKKAIIQQFPYDEKLRRYEDADLLIRILNVAKVYSTITPIAVVNTEYSSASNKRNDISEDYIGHLSMKDKCFWAKMCIYRIYLENRKLYPVETKKLYPTWKYRYDLLFLYKLFNLFR